VDYRIRWQQQRRQRQRKRLLIVPAALALATVLYLLVRGAGGAGSNWVFEAPSHALPHFAVTPAFIYVAWPDGHLIALQTATGRPTAEAPVFSVPEAFNATPTVEEHTLYLGSDAGILRALNARTGQLVWDRDTGGPIRCQPLVISGRLFVGNGSGLVYCFRTGGAKMWSRQLEDGISGQPALVGRQLIVATVRGAIYALDFGTGKTLWRQDLQSPDVPTPIFSPVTAAPPVVLIGSDDGYLYVLDAATGRPAREPYYTAGLVREAPAISDQAIAFGSTDGWLRVISHDAMQPLWAYALPGPVTAGPTIAGNLVLVACPTRLIALELSSGRFIRSWKGEQLGGDLVVAAKTIYVGTNQGRIMALAMP